jgi:hypothetical protein
MKDEIQKVTLGTNEALRVTADGEFIWHPEADAMIENGDFTSSPAMRHILRALRKALAAPDLQAELDATNRQVEILSDALAESRREVAALKAVQEPIGYLFQHEETGLTTVVDVQQVEWGFEKNNPRHQKIGPVYTTPPAAQRPDVDSMIALARADERARLQPKKIKAVQKDDYCHGDERYYAND